MTAEVIGHTSERAQAASVSVIGTGMAEFLIASFAICALLLAQLMLTTHIHGMNYAGNDGALYQATVLAALEFNSPFHVTNISPVQGVGSQLLTMNVWANPAFWPFAFLSREMATEISALVALGIFAIGCYIMMRCFDVPVVPSVVAAQSCILLFAPTLLLAVMPTNYYFCAGSAVVYAPYFVALGLLSRLEPGSWRHFGLITAGIFVSLLYSIYCDPMWTMVNAVSWTVPFSVVALGSWNWRTMLVRCAALGCCLGVLLLSGAIGYLHTLSQYTARVQFAEALDRVRGPGLVSALAWSAYIKTFYLACIVGWLLGLLTLRGRPRLLVTAAAVSGAVFAAYCVVYLLLLNAPWVLPIPLYVEHSLFVLFLAGALAGYWGVVRAVAWSSLRLAALAGRRVRVPAGPVSQLPALRFVGVTLGLVAAAVVPAVAANYALNRPNPFAGNPMVGAWSKEPELERFFADNVGRGVGRPFRGTTAFWTKGIEHDYTMANLWANGVPTINEYSQLVTPQALYFLHQVFRQDVVGHLNGFHPFFRDGYSSPYWKALQMFGVRYSVGVAALPAQYIEGFPLITLPYRPPGEKAPGLWYIYQLPRPNVGDYSPTEVVTAQSAADMAAAMSEPDFDYTRQAVLSAPIKGPLVPARDMRLSLTRGSGLHVSGRSDGTSLVVLPYQFSNCLRARDERVRLVRTNLMMTGMIFSGDLDTDIVFDYGLFSPACRRADLADMKRLEVKIDLRMPHLSGDRLFPDWDDARTKLRAAAKALSLDHSRFMLPFSNSFFTLPFMH